MKMRSWCGACAIAALSACATAELSQAGSRVQIVGSAPSEACRNLGVVIGQGGGMYGGAWIANDQLVKYAINDAQNKAAALGATHLQLSPPQLGGANGTTSTATVSGFAYQCAPGERPAPSAKPIGSAGP